MSFEMSYHVLVNPIAPNKTWKVLFVPGGSRLILVEPRICLDL